MLSDSDSGSDSSSGWADFASRIEQKRKQDHSCKREIPPLSPSSSDEWDAFVTGIVASHQTDSHKVPIQKQSQKKNEEELLPSSGSDEPSYENTADEFLPDSPLVEFGNEESLEEINPAGEIPLSSCFHTF
jgi:hypothetical protein